MHRFVAVVTQDAAQHTADAHRIADMPYNGYEIEIEEYGVDENDHVYCVLLKGKQIKGVAFASVEEAKAWIDAQ